MNTTFKSEFQKLNPNEIKDIINRCAGQDILEFDVVKDLTHPYSRKYALKYINDDRYGFWIVEYGWKKAESAPLSIGSGFFEHQIKITPFRVYFENSSGRISNPYSKPHARKQLEDYLFIYINKRCPSYQAAIREETEKFIKFIDISNTKNEQTK